MQYSWPPPAAVETRDSLGPLVAPERAATPRSDLAGRAARAGAAGGLVASAIAGVPYYLAVREQAALPWLQIAPLFVAFVIATGALYGAGAAYGMRAIGAALGPRGPASRAVISIGGATMGAAIIGVLPGSLGLAYFGSLPYPFVGTATLAMAPIVGTSITSWSLAASGGSRGRAALAALGTAALFCAIGALGVGTLDDATVVAAFRDATASAGHEDSPLGLGLVGLVVGALLGVVLGCQIGATVVLARGRAADG